MEPYDLAVETERSIEWLARQFFEQGSLPVAAACKKISEEHDFPEDWLFVMVLSRVDEIEETIDAISDDLAELSARWN